MCLVFICSIFLPERFNFLETISTGSAQVVSKKLNGDGALSSIPIHTYMWARAIFDATSPPVASSSYRLGCLSPSGRSSPCAPYPRASYQHPPSNPIAMPCGVEQDDYTPSSIVAAYRAYPPPPISDRKHILTPPAPHAIGGRRADTASSTICRRAPHSGTQSPWRNTPWRAACRRLSLPTHLGACTSICI